MLGFGFDSSVISSLASQSRSQSWSWSLAIVFRVYIAVRSLETFAFSSSSGVGASTRLESVLATSIDMMELQRYE